MAKRTSKRKTRTSIEDVSDKTKISSSVVMPNKDKEKKPVSLSNITSLLESVTTSINDNKAIKLILTDIALAQTIIVSSILAPKDMGAAKITLSIEEGVLEKEPPGDLLAAIENHFRSTYNLESMLAPILDDALFDVGSYALLVIPESTLGGLVGANKVTGMESYQDLLARNKNHYGNKGILSGATPEVRSIEICDNLNHIVTEDVRRNALSSTVSDKLGFSVGLENKRVIPVAALKGGNHANDNDSNPLVMHIPSDAIIPVHTPSDPSDHLGYYIVLDSNGVPITNVKASASLENLKKKIEAASRGNSLGNLINATGITLKSSAVKADPSALLSEYTRLVDLELNSQLKNGVYGKEVSVGKPEEVYRIMLARAMENQKTKLLYVPKEILTYIAFSYNELGVGKSLLEDTKIFSSLRAILLFAEVMAGVKNAVGRTKLEITLDDDDPDASATIDKAKHQFANFQSSQLPLGQFEAGDIIKSLQAASVDVQVNGGEAFPGTKTELSEGGREYRAPDSDLGENLKRMHYAGLGIPPEIVDSAMDGETATLVISRNQLLSKSIAAKAALYETMISDFIQKYTRCSGELLQLIEEADLGETNVMDYIRAIRFTLPHADLAKIKAQSEAYDEYSDFIDKVMETYITEDMLAGFTDDEVDLSALDALRISYGNLLKRDWMAQQNILPEIAAKLDSNEVGPRILEHNADVMTAFKKILGKSLKDEGKLARHIEKIRTDVQEAAEEAEPEEEPTTTDDDAGDIGGDEDITEEESGDDEPTEEGDVEEEETQLTEEEEEENPEGEV